MPQAAEKKPSVGRIVMYVPTPGSPETSNAATVVPAIVVRTWEDTSYQNDEINLRVFTDGEYLAWRTSVPHSADKQPGTWHWPEIK